MSLSIGLPAVSRSPSPDRGFTLIEVLVALTVAALLLVALSRAIGTGMVGAVRATSIEKATMLAQSALDPLGVIAPLRDRDSADLDRDGYHVHVAVSRYEVPGVPHIQGYLKLFRLNATVAWREGFATRSLSLTTLRLGPEGQAAP
jgi:general secretion pathway protein I